MEQHIRAFIGLALPADCRALAGRLAQALAPLARGRLTPTRADNAHVTLRFLGDVPTAGPAGLPAITDALAGIPFSPFVLRFAGGGFFPKASRPRVVWAGMADGAAPSRALAVAIDAALARLSLPPPDKPFAAHLTLARLKEPGRGGNWPAMLERLQATTWPEVAVTAFTLWQSVLTPAGAHYAVLAQFPAHTS